ncbi:hypothetical protein [Undibacterium terreum]|nr:hypothetical protein [Undibacterium terreum]
MQFRPLHQDLALKKISTSLSLCGLLVLAACGGGGGGSSSTTPTTPTTPVIPPVTSLTITGVAATSAPLVAANIKVVDAKGAAVSLVDANGGSIPYGTTNTADGSYRLNLSSSGITMPLLIQAAGRDVTGNSVILYSMLQATTSPTIANITPLSTAVVAEILGANPRSVFNNAASNASSIALLSNATMLAAASTHIKTIVAANLTDAKITNTKTLDFFQDATFVTNKTLLDVALEGLTVRIAKDSNGNDQLQISNKFAIPGLPDVTVDLATAKTELAKTTGTTLANAVKSTAKTTVVTSPLATASTMDNLTIALNKAIAQGSAASAFSGYIATAAMPAPGSSGTGTYTYNGRSAAALTAKLAGYAANNYQLSKLQIMGCADTPSTPLKACVYFQVGATVSDNSGKTVDLFYDTVTYNKTSTSWTFSGNGRNTSTEVYPLAYASYGMDGSLTSGSTNPSVGVEIAIVGESPPGTKSMDGAIVQLLSGYSVPFAYCGGTYLCASSSPSVPASATGELKDFLLQQPALGWIGSKDGQAGAKYVISTTAANASATQNLSVYLPASVPSDYVTSQFPALDGVSASNPVVPAALIAGTNLNWANWAAANPDSHVFMLRFIISSDGAAPIVSDFSVPNDLSTTTTLAATTIPDGYVPSSYQLLIGAQDNLGRRFFTTYKSAP